MHLRALPLLLALSTLTPQCAKPEGDDGAKPAAPAPDKPAAKDDTAEPAVRVPIDGLPAFGSASALVTIVAFTDYECPYCARADERIAQLRAEYGDRVRLVVASLPLPFHEHAAPAARAFLAAVEQGKGEAMHLRLFARRAPSGAPAKPLDDEALRAAATEIGLDLDAFDRARRGPRTEAALAQAQALATRLFVSGTPTFFVNGRRLVGARPAEAFRALVDEELGKAEKLVERGVARDKVYAAVLAAASDATPPRGEGARGLLGGDGPEQVVEVGVEDAPVHGPRSAPITIVLFSDFECPFCVRAERTLKEIEAANPGKVKVAFRHKPLPMHPHARLAAKASIAADRQGRFWDYHDALLAHREALERADLEKYAVDLGLDAARFRRDLDDPALDARIAADEKRAEQLGVKGTPTAFVNGRRIVGAQPLGAWLAAVERSVAPAVPTKAP